MVANQPDKRSTTLSHDLAAIELIDTRHAALSHEESVYDLGWNQEPSHNAKYWIRGLHNEDVWTLVRRLNKEVFELKAIKKVPAGDLDLVVAPESECSPNKLRSEVERLYMGVLLGLFAFLKGLARLRSWHETRRTGVFCTVYFLAWYLDILVFTVMGAFITCIVSPKARLFMFPPAPLSMVDMNTGGLAKPMAGTLGSTDASTGAPQNLKGESVENEASNFVSSVAAIATNLLTGQDPHGAPGEMEGGSKQGFKPQLDVTTMAVVKDKAEGMDRPSQDKTKAPMEEEVSTESHLYRKRCADLSIIGVESNDAVVAHSHFDFRYLGTPGKVRALSRSFDSGISMTDFHSILNPTPPFDQLNHRRRLASYLAPLAVGALLIPRDILFRGITFGVGVGLFGDPLLVGLYHYLQGNGWTKFFHPNNTLFRGVPTNLQLALTLLRMGEANKAPIPPPARVHHAPPDKSIEIDGEVIDATLGDQPLGASQSQLEEVAERNPEMAEHAGGEDTEIQQAVGHGKKREKVFGLLKGSAKEAAKAVSGVEKLRAKTGSEHAKQRVGVVPSKHNGPQIIGPVEFSARYEGQPGYVYVNSSADIPFVAFNRNSLNSDNLDTVWALNIDGITELRKHSGYGMKSKLAAGWATDGPIYDSLRIVDQDGKDWIVTALPYRDALFNRLCAIGKETKWEVW
ncbi:hypothetical protein CCHL11_07137 [Colletotrichum chlorophyti]|uniref:Uncharacterized protein n=1 Tax=Colletotrichum chlorophyti TaxID=708187 RepID=A0A1Q8S0P8_9PEZI|nr:hypothetical protein CCHL11_07137 [Colletotrichum chlorophyti]